MKFIVAALLSITLLAGFAGAEEKNGLKNEKDKLSYTIGVSIGSNFKNQELDVNPDALIKGVKDALSGGKTALTEKEMQDIMTAVQKDMQTKHAARQKSLAEKNKKEGESFLAENKKKDGVKTTASGLQYKVIKEGTGKSPKATDTVSVHYKGTLINNTEFDSSYKRNEPTSFPVNGVIPGWTEALQLMKAGSKYQLFIPANLAYGDRGAGAMIGPNSALIFEVELLSIQ